MNVPFVESAEQPGGLWHSDRIRDCKLLNGRKSGVQKCRHLNRTRGLAQFSAMLKSLQALLSVMAHATDRELARQIRYRKTGNRILRDKLPKQITVSLIPILRLIDGCKYLFLITASK